MIDDQVWNQLRDTAWLEPWQQKMCQVDPLLWDEYNPLQVALDHQVGMRWHTQQQLKEQAAHD